MYLGLPQTGDVQTDETVDEEIDKVMSFFGSRAKGTEAAIRKNSRRAQPAQKVRGRGEQEERWPIPEAPEDVPVSHSSAVSIPLPDPFPPAERSRKWWASG